MGAPAGTGSLSEAGPAKAIVAVTASDTADLTYGSCRALLVTTATTAKLTDALGNVVTSVPLQAGYNPISVSRVWSTGTTTTTGIFALY